MYLHFLWEHMERLYEEFDADGLVEWGLPLVQRHEPGTLPGGPIVVPAGVTVQVGGLGGWRDCSSWLQGQRG